jgi:hypothetical protein
LAGVNSSGSFGGDLLIATSNLKARASAAISELDGLRKSVDMYKVPGARCPDWIVRRLEETTARCDAMESEIKAQHFASLGV